MTNQIEQSYQEKYESPLSSPKVGAVSFLSFVHTCVSNKSYSVTLPLQIKISHFGFILCLRVVGNRKNGLRTPRIVCIVSWNLLSVEGAIIVECVDIVCVASVALLTTHALFCWLAK